VIFSLFCAGFRSFLKIRFDLFVRYHSGDCSSLRAHTHIPQFSKILQTACAQKLGIMRVTRALGFGLIAQAKLWILVVAETPVCQTDIVPADVAPSTRCESRSVAPLRHVYQQRRRNYFQSKRLTLA
jgi:hypothetical protein